MSTLLYNLFIRLYPFIIRITAPFNPKAQLWLAGRKGIFEKLAEKLNGNNKVIWMHCSSLGEFEQGRPVLEKIKSDYPSYKILLTFFSPSGYEVRKDYKGADFVFYLPMDSRVNAKRFYDIVNPSLVVFIKYEYWFYYLAEAKRRNVPLLLVSGIFRKDQPFFKPYGSLHRKMLGYFTHFFVQSDLSAHLLNQIGIKDNVSVNGDTRFDRVTEIAEQFEPIPLIEEFVQQNPVIVAGSTWSEDDEELDHFANTNPDIRFIIAPHDIGSDRIKECQHLYKHSILFSSLSPGKIPAGKNTLIIDNIGMLSSLYKYATICFVGGAFGDDGVHNVLEAAVYYKPVVFGPEYEKYIEAVELVEAGGGISIENALELEKTFRELLENLTSYQEASAASGRYVWNKKGATSTVLEYIYEKRLLTN